MKAFILCMLCGVAFAGSAFAESDGDHSARPRPEFDYLQQEILVTPRVNLGGDIQPQGITPVTTDFGYKGFVNLTESANGYPMTQVGD